MTEADLVRVQQLLELMFVGGLRFDADGRVINATRWDYETSIFVSIELLATVGRPTVCHSVESTIVSENIRFMRIFAGVNSLGRGRQTTLGVVDDGHFWRFWLLRLRKLHRYGKQYYMTICYPLSTGK